MVVAMGGCYGWWYGGCYAWLLWVVEASEARWVRRIDVQVGGCYGGCYGWWLWWLPWVVAMGGGCVKLMSKSVYPLHLERRHKGTDENLQRKWPLKPKNPKKTGVDVNVTRAECLYNQKHASLRLSHRVVGPSRQRCVCVRPRVACADKGGSDWGVAQ